MFRNWPCDGALRQACAVIKNIIAFQNKQNYLVLTITPQYCCVLLRCENSETGISS
jgi:hypothetical protein